MTSRPSPSELERWFEAHTTLERVESARAIYKLMPSQSDRTLPLVYVPYDLRSEAHWSDAARIADYVAHVPLEARRVLDIGPGDGWPSLPVARALPHVELVGVDPSPRRAEVCAANAARLDLPNARFVTADAAALPFEAATFDAVLAANSLEEASNPAAVFAELARVLRPGGALRVSYQDWRLGTSEVETVMFWDGTFRRAHEGSRVLLATYVRRVQNPPLERRYTLVLPADGPAAEAHTEALLAAAAAPRAWGETRLQPGPRRPALRAPRPARPPLDARRAAPLDHRLARRCPRRGRFRHRARHRPPRRGRPPHRPRPHRLGRRRHPRRPHLRGSRRSHRPHHRRPPRHRHG